MSLYSFLPESRQKAISYLKNHTLFSRLQESQLEQIASCLNRRSYSSGVTLFHQDMPGLMLYMIEEGHVRVFGVGLTGQEHTLNTFGPGDIFGELSILDGKPRSASAVTMTPTIVWLLSEHDLDDIIGRYPTVARAIIETLSERVREAAQHVEAIIFQDVLGRLAFELLNLCEKHGHRQGNGLCIDMPLTQTDLATIVGATRESVNKSLSTLRARNLVEMEGTQVTVLDLKGLARIVQDRGR